MRRESNPRLIARRDRQQEPVTTAPRGPWTTINANELSETRQFTSNGTSLTMLLTSILVTLVLPALALADHWQSPFIKSFNDVQKQCISYLRLTDETIEQYINSGYLDEHSTRKLIHCFLNNLHAWDDVDGVKDYVLSQFFVPSPSDTCYRNRTEDCLSETVAHIPQHELLKRAHRSFLCYYRNYGNIDDGKHFIPYSNVIFKEHLKESFHFQDVPRTVLQQWANGDIVDTPEFAESYYTFVLHSGFYNPDIGFNLDRVYVQVGNPVVKSEETRDCEVSVRKQFCEEPKRLVETFRKCLKDNVPTLKLIQDIAKELLETRHVFSLDSSGLSPSCYSCGGSSPCKTCRQLSNGKSPCYNGQCY